MKKKISHESDDRCGNSRRDSGRNTSLSEIHQKGEENITLPIGTKVAVNGETGIISDVMTHFETQDELTGQNRNI